jgi:hypothetical protein
MARMERATAQNDLRYQRGAITPAIAFHLNVRESDLAAG